MRVYINKSEYKSIRDAWHYLRELYDGLSEENAEIMSETMNGLVSIVEKYQNPPKKIKTKIDQSTCPHQFIEMGEIFKCKHCGMTMGEAMHAGHLDEK